MLVTVPKVNLKAKASIFSVVCAAIIYWYLGSGAENAMWWDKPSPTQVAAESVIKGYNTKDTDVVKAAFAESVALGNNKGLGPPKTMPMEKIIGALKGVMFDSFGFSFVEPAITINGTQAVIDTKLSIDTSLPAWETASGKPAPFPQVPVKEMFGGKDAIPAQMTLETDAAGKVTSIYWHLGPGAEKGKSAVPPAAE